MDGRTVLVLGAGRSGRAAAELLQRRGAHVHVYDRNPAALENLAEGIEPLSGDWPDFAAYDQVIQSPGVPLPDGVRATPEVDLAAAYLDSPVIGVTGTNGKSTTTVLIGDILRAAGYEVAVGGNLGTALCELVSAPADFVVAELSSFQLEHAEHLHARVAVLLNLAPDHLDRHGTIEAYGACKARLAEKAEPGGTVVANADDAWARDVAAHASAASFPFSTEVVLDHGVSIADGAIRIARDGAVEASIPLDRLSHAARTPIANSLAAAAAATALGVAPLAIAEALGAFAGLPHRAREICVRAGARYVDDSKATNPSAAAASLTAQTTPVVWIAGGRNKGLSFAPLAEAGRAARASVFFGEAAREISDALGGASDIVVTLAEAVARAASHARAGDTVLLAPACASFDQFESFEARGRAFAALAEALPDRGVPC